MSNLLLTESLKSSWRTKAFELLNRARQGLVVDRTPPTATSDRPELPENITRVVFAPPPSQLEPITEEFGDVLAAIAPISQTGAINSALVSSIVVAHACTTGMTFESLLPFYYMSGVNYIDQGNTRFLLRMPESLGLPVVYLEEFPRFYTSIGVNTDLDSLLTESPEAPFGLNRIGFVSNGSLLIPTAYERYEDIPEGHREGHMYPNSSRYISGPSSYLFEIYGRRHYAGCYRLPTDEELNHLFQTVIRTGSLYHSQMTNLIDFFSGQRITSRIITEANSELNRVVTATQSLRAAQATAAPTERAATTTNVPAPNTYSGESVVRPARNILSVPRTASQRRRTTPSDIANELHTINNARTGAWRIPPLAGTPIEPAPQPTGTGSITFTTAPDNDGISNTLRSTYTRMVETYLGPDDLAGAPQRPAETASTFGQLASTFIHDEVSLASSEAGEENPDVEP